MQINILTVFTVIMVFFSLLSNLFPRSCANAAVLAANNPPVNQMPPPVHTFQNKLRHSPKKPTQEIHSHRADFLKGTNTRIPRNSTAPAPPATAENASSAQESVYNFVVAHQNFPLGILSGNVANDLMQRCQIDPLLRELLKPVLKCVLFNGLLVIKTDLHLQWLDLFKKIARTMLLDLSTATAFDLMIAILPIPGGWGLDSCIRWVSVMVMKVILTSHVLPDDADLVRQV